jgi:RNA polymerase-binding transcription factor DksA
MDTIKNALHGQLQQTIDRLKGMGGAVIFEDYPGALEEDGQGEAGGDAASLSVEQELAFAARGRLVERANRLAEALERLRSGEYGICETCGDQIAAARLRAIPEVTTCVACQDREERRAYVTPAREAIRRGRCC